MSHFKSAIWRAFGSKSGGAAVSWAMFCKAKGSTALQRYARSLEAQEAAVQADFSLAFPMYTVSLEMLMQMEEVLPHEELKAKNVLVEFEERMGKAAFVSHQWVDAAHPDPEGKQLRVFQDALKHAMSLREISLDAVTATVMPSAKGLQASELWSSALFFWYDYFSCPQLEKSRSETNEQLKAIDSIPAYVSSCAFFFALCPVVENPSETRLLTPASWAERGWCRVERAVREFSVDTTWIMVRSCADLELIVTPGVSPTGALGGRPAGEGAFTVPSDRTKLQPLLAAALRRKLLGFLASQDLVNFRLLLNLQSVHFRGLPQKPRYNLIPGFQADRPRLQPHELQVEKFLYENGFQSVHETDPAGWSPVHYGALRGDAVVIQGLLAKRADPNRLTKQDQPTVGLPPFTSALTICSCFKHNDAARLLLTARAKVDGGLLKPLEFAAAANNVEGIRLLCEARSNPSARSFLGFSPMEVACCRGAEASLVELVSQVEARSGSLDFSGALWCALALKAEGGTANIVEWLLERRADVNTSRDPWAHSSLYGAISSIKAMEYRLGRRNKATRQFYHMKGATPLLMAMLESQFEGAACLIAAGAQLDLRNARGWSAADLIRGQSVPEFLRQAAEGNLEECFRIAALGQKLIRL